MHILQINSTANYGSTGRIAEKIGESVLEHGYKSTIGYGRNVYESRSNLYRIGGKFEQGLHLLHTRLFDTHGFHSTNATKDLIQFIKNSRPSLIHLHNLHGYYLNIEYLFNFLKKYNKPVIWTLHDCWPYTGHCCHYVRVNCKKWKTECHSCPLTKLYPKSFLIDNSTNNFRKKKDIFTDVPNMHIITVSKWLKKEVEQSFLNQYPIETIYNGVDANLFNIRNISEVKRNLGIARKKVILGVSNKWTNSKGFDVFLELSKLLSDNEVIVMLGLNKKQIQGLPKNIIGKERTNNISELIDFYNIADVLLNPTLAETFGLVVVEAMACGTPCVVNNTSALPEIVDTTTGIVLDKPDIHSYLNSISYVLSKGKNQYKEACRSRVVNDFNQTNQLYNYIELYKKLGLN